MRSVDLDRSRLGALRSRQEKRQNPVLVFRLEVGRPQRLDQTDQDTAEHGPGQRADAPQHRRGERPELGLRDLVIDVLDRVLDKGLVIAGDIQVNLLDIELLTIKLRLVIASLDTAREVGINWWENDPWLSADAGRRAARENAVQASTGPANTVQGETVADGGRELKEENRRLRRRVRELESGE